MKPKAPARAKGIRINRVPDKWEVQDAARTIATAEEHKKNPALMKAVREHVGALHAAVSEPTMAKSPNVKRKP